MRFTNLDKLVVYQNEDNSKEISFEIDSSLSDCDIYIDFEKSDGTKVKVHVNTNTYLIPKALLSDKGYIKCQLIAYRGLTFVEKSKTYKFYVDYSINATEYIEETQPDVIEELMTEKADDLAYEDNVLQLKANGQRVGTPITLNGGGFEELNGTEEAPVYLQDLLTGNYILNGFYKPFESADISGTGEDSFIQVYRNEVKVDVYFIDVHYSRWELYEVSIDNDTFTRDTIPIKEVALHIKPTDENTPYLVAGFTDQSIIENSVPQSSMIMLIFPGVIPIGFTSKIVFKVGTSLPSFTCNTTVLWFKDGVYSNTLTLETNKIYTIEFEKDVFDLIGNVKVREV